MFHRNVVMIMPVICLPGGKLTITICINSRARASEGKEEGGSLSPFLKRRQRKREMVRTEAAQGGCW